MRTQKKQYKMPRNYTQLGSYLRTLRIGKNFTQRDVSMALGYSSAQFISNFENGIAAPPLAKLKLMLDMLDGDASQIIKLSLEGERLIISNVLKERPKSHPSLNSKKPRLKFLESGRRIV